MYRGPSRGPCIGSIYPTLLGFGGIQAIILSINYFVHCSIFSILLIKLICAIYMAVGRTSKLNYLRNVCVDLQRWEFSSTLCWCSGGMMLKVPWSGDLGDKHHYIIILLMEDIRTFEIGFTANIMRDHLQFFISLN